MRSGSADVAPGSRVTRAQRWQERDSSLERRARLRQTGSGGATRESRTLGAEEEFTLALHLWRAIIGLPALLGYAWLSAACQSEAPRMTPREVREALGRELQLVALERCTLARFGSAHDGGYLMCKNLIDGLGAVYSYGVGPNDDWGCALASRHSVPVHQYDCLHHARPTCTVGTFVFHNECVGPKREHHRFAGSTRWRTTSRRTATPAGG